MTVVRVDKTDVRMRLRKATGHEHQNLEQTLALLSPPLKQERFQHNLARFWGFHVVWEPSLQRLPHLAPILEGRSKLVHLRADLMAMGLSGSDIDALPRCLEAETLAASQARAIGSLYVMEGSTLGGQVIARALAETTWAPVGGLSYFTPYGAETGVRWRAFQAWLDAQSFPASEPEIEAGAIQTFQLLSRWLALETAA